MRVFFVPKNTRIAVFSPQKFGMIHVGCVRTENTGSNKECWALLARHPTVRSITPYRGLRDGNDELCMRMRLQAVNGPPLRFALFRDIPRWCNRYLGRPIEDDRLCSIRII
jgi:hypothetical protein